MVELLPVGEAARVDARILVNLQGCALVTTHQERQAVGDNIVGELSRIPARVNAPAFGEDPNLVDIGFYILVVIL